MPSFQSDLLDVLTPLADGLAGDAHLTAAERGEVLRMAQGMSCKDSANAGNVSPETIRARRKRIYRKLGASGASDVIARLLAAALGSLAATGQRLRGQPETNATA